MNMKQGKAPYSVVLSRYITEKAGVLEGLKDATSNRSVARCASPKYLFVVDKNANKREIALAIEEMYGVSVTSVNTLIVKKKKKRVRGREGFKAGFKKAVITLQKGDKIGESI